MTRSTILTAAALCLFGYIGFEVYTHSNIPSPLGDGALCADNVADMEYFCAAPDGHTAYSIVDGKKTDVFTW